MKSRLPAGVLWLLKLGVPIDLRESISGDLEEDFVYRARLQGRLRAAVHTWREAASMTMQFLRERAVAERGVPPIADEVVQRSGVFESIWQDVRFGARMLRRQPAFAITATLVLALGSGATVAIFSLVDAALWRPLPYPDPPALVALGEQRPREQRVFGAVSAADFLDWRRDNQSFSSMAGHFDQAMNLTGTGEPLRVKALLVSPGFLQALGVPPSRGRDFLPEEETAGRNQVVLLTDGFWRRRYGGDPAIVGQTLSLDGKTHEIIGILPASFWWKTRPDLLVPLVPMMLTPDERSARSLHFLEIVARRRDGVGAEQARADLDTIGRRLEKEVAPLNNGHLPSLLPLRDALLGNTRPALVLVLASVVMVLLIACTNVAMLVLARATTRRKELALRTALGAGRRRLFRQLLTESTVLGLAGGALGLVAAIWMLAALRALLPPQYSALPGIDRAAIDARVVFAALAGSLVTSLVFGSVSGFTLPGGRLSLALNEEGRTVGHSGRHRVRTALVVAEVALSMMLLVGAGLLGVSLKRVLDVSPGFQPDSLLTAQLALPASKYPDRVRMAAFYERLLERIQQLPSVVSAGATTALPFGAGGSRASFQIEGRANPGPTPNRAQIRVVTPGYLETLRVPLVRGRLIDDRDRDRTQPVAVVNNETARRYWPGEDPLGRRISFSFVGAGDTEWLEIVGIVGDMRHAGLEAAFEPEVYVPILQARLFPTLGSFAILTVRGAGDLAQIAPEVQTAVFGVDADQPLDNVQSMESLIERSVAPRRLNVWLLIAFATTAVLLAATGLYGVMACLVIEQTQEIGVRMALGASPLSVLGLVVRQAGSMTLAGVATGLAAAWALSRYLATLLFGVSATDPVVYALVALALLAVAMLAVALPAIRATRIDPLRAIRA